MLRSKENQETGMPATVHRPIWRQAIGSVFGAAQRLHQYRDARDVLLQHVIHEQERRIRQQDCCGEQR